MLNLVFNLSELSTCRACHRQRASNMLPQIRQIINPFSHRILEISSFCFHLHNWYELYNCNFLHQCLCDTQKYQNNKCVIMRFSDCVCRTGPTTSYSLSANRISPITYAMPIMWHTYKTNLVFGLIPPHTTTLQQDVEESLVKPHIWWRWN